MGDTWLERVPDELLHEVLSRLVAASDLCAVALASRRLNALVEDRLWGALVVARLPRLAALLDASPSPPAWWVGRSWRSRLSALVGGQSFDAQVFNRELENEQEDFLLSCYDASCSLSPAAAAALRSGDAAAPLHFTARYLCMGRMPAVTEAEVAAERLRLAPPGSSPHAVFGGGSLGAPGLRVGEEVEVQWKGRRLHPYGWWLGTVLSVRGGRITLMFRQYPRTSVWHRVKAPIRPGKETVVNGDCSFGYVGGLRRLAPDEREEWRRHGAPQPPAPELLQALEAAAEEEWSDEEEPDLDVELAAELEDELEELAAAAAHPGPVAAEAEGAADEGAAQQAGAAAAFPAAGAGAEVAADEEGEEAGFAPAAPPREPIALRLGQDGAAAAPQQGGLAVVLAAALPPGTAPLQAQPHAPSLA